MPHLQTRDAQLFVHLSWGTFGNRPILNDDEFRQAAYGAIKARTRSHLCQVLAIDGTPCHIHMIVQFRASLPINDLVRVSREAAKEALIRMQEMTSGNVRELPCYWEWEYAAHTLSATEAAHAKEYIRRQIGEA